MSEKKKFLLRLDEALFEAIEKWAADDLRSVNAEIEFLLAAAARRAGRLRSGSGPPQKSGGAKDGRAGHSDGPPDSPAGSV